MSLTRREFLGVMGTAVALGATVSARRPALAAGAGRSGAEFTEPKVLTSVGGRLEVELVAAPTQVPFRGDTRFAYSYGGTTPGPTLRVRPGDVLSIRLRNRLGETTNLHTHGLHVSPSGSADNVFVSVPDGEERTYTYRIPADHRSGLFWYHPHHHEMVARQVFGGLAGAIVVEDAIDAVPELAAARERLLVLNDAVIGSSADVLDVSMMEQMVGREGDTVLVNGVEAPTIDAQAGTLEHWRILNASASRYYRLALDGHALHVIGTDGGRLVRPVEVEEILLAPGERVEVLVTPSTAGRARLRSLPYDRGTIGMGGDGPAPASGRVLIANLDVSGDAAPAALPTVLASPESLTLPAATGEREVVLAMGMGGGMGGFTIDGKSFDAARTDITTRLDRVEDWTLTNTSSMDHPFHLHVWPFQIVARSDGAPIDVGWKDTVNVPAGTSVTVRIPFTEIRGRTVYHCHILDHEDLGMMGVIRVRAA